MQIAFDPLIEKEVKCKQGRHLLKFMNSTLVNFPIRNTQECPSSGVVYTLQACAGKPEKHHVIRKEMLAWVTGKGHQPRHGEVRENG